MQFLIVGLDGKDSEAMQRRLKAREHHIELGNKLVKDGNVWFGAVIFNDKNQMAGSAFFVDFEDEDALQSWLDNEPYITGDVWKDIQIYKCNTRDPWQFNRPREFYEERQKKK